MSTVKPYKVELGGGRVATMRLNDADAAAYGDAATPVETGTPAAPTKARTARNKARDAAPPSE